MKPIRNNIVNTAMTPKMMNIIPLPISPLYICPKPTNKKERTAANPSLFLSVMTLGVGLVGGGGGATLTPHFGQISALASISAPQLTQNLVFLSLMSYQPDPNKIDGCRL